MRQVPHYLIIGNGRVARHIQHYFSLLHLSYSTWQRQQSVSELDNMLPMATHVLLLIRDDAIETFINEHLSSASALIVHFSGSLVCENAFGAHPLMTFSNELYGLPHYQQIPFILDHDAPAFEALLPGLPNQSVSLHKSLKSKYHALCVLSGNFSCLLWQKLFHALESEFGIPAAIAQPYMLQQTQNLLTNPGTALTGPLVRGDQQTLEKNLAALNADPFQAVYASFVACYANRKNQEMANECL